LNQVFRQEAFPQISFRNAETFRLNLATRRVHMTSDVRTARKAADDEIMPFGLAPNRRPDIGVEQNVFARLR
jgi:hypothetical protein